MAAFIAGEATAELEQAVRRHVTTCEGCRVLLGELARAPAPVLVEGKYLFGEEIGKGGLARVLRGRHVGLGVPVAIKVLREAYLDHPSVRRGFEREARIAASLVHPNIVRTLDLGHLADGTPFIVMELLEGHDLASELASSKRGDGLPLARVVAMGLAVCEALSVAHRVGVIHRDVKPANIFAARGTEASETFKVLDFGLAKALQGSSFVMPGDSLTATGIVGTPAFMSPEQIRMLTTLDHRADLWSLGAAMFNLLTGRRPFARGADFDEQRAAILRDPPPDLRRYRPEAPAELAAILSSAMTRDPASRPSSASEFKAALAAVAASLPELAPDTVRCR